MDRAFVPARRQYGGSARTLRGEIVKSQGEKQIADFFYSNRIKYVYEDQAKTNQSAFRAKISRPDFYLPDYNMYVEYWGMVDVGDSAERNRYREDMNWKKKQYKDNGIKFVSLYPWHLNELEGAFKAEFKKVMGKDLVTGPVGEKSVYALPISNGFRQALQRAVPNRLELMELQLVYQPYFFVGYDCFTQGTAFYERVNLSSRGTLVLEGQNGYVVDIIVESGTSPNIRKSGFYVDCRMMAQGEVAMSKISEAANFSKIDATLVKITKEDAEKIAKVEIAKHLERTFTRTYKNGKTYSRTLRPYESNVRIVSVKPANLPIITGIFRYKDRIYVRSMQATTNRIVADDLIYCNVEGKHFGESISLCEECGKLACKDHGKLCYICSKSLCEEHVASKGLLLKKYYCSEHIPS